MLREHPVECGGREIGEYLIAKDVDLRRLAVGLATALGLRGAHQVQNQSQGLDLVD